MQLDLLSYEPPAAVTSVVVHLPVTKWGPSIWRPLVEKAAAGLVKRRTDRAKQVYWEQCCMVISNRMWRRGATEVEITEEIARFHQCVGDRLTALAREEAS